MSEPTERSPGIRILGRGVHDQGERSRGVSGILTVSWISSVQQKGWNNLAGGVRERLTVVETLGKGITLKRSAYKTEERGDAGGQTKLSPAGRR